VTGPIQGSQDSWEDSAPTKIWVLADPLITDHKNSTPLGIIGITPPATLAQDVLPTVLILDWDESTRDGGK